MICPPPCSAAGSGAGARHSLGGSWASSRWAVHLLWASSPPTVGPWFYCSLTGGSY